MVNINRWNQWKASLFQFSAAEFRGTGGREQFHHLPHRGCSLGIYDHDGEEGSLDVTKMGIWDVKWAPLSWYEKEQRHTVPCNIRSPKNSGQFRELLLLLVQSLNSSAHDQERQDIWTALQISDKLGHGDATDRTSTDVIKYSGCMRE